LFCTKTSVLEKRILWIFNVCGIIFKLVKNSVWQLGFLIRRLFLNQVIEFYIKMKKSMPRYTPSLAQLLNSLA